MHRYSEEDVAAVVLAATAELRRRQGQSGALGRAARATVTETVRSVRSGVLPRERYEAARGESDPPYTGLPQDRQDEDRLLWLITQALTGD